VAWSQGKLAFVARVSAAVRDAQQEVVNEASSDSESEIDPDDLVENLMNDFPFIPEDI
jgi:hypothetical protein